MKCKHIIIAALLCAAPQLSSAALINDMQSCQGLLDFIDQKLDNAPDKYETADVTTVRKGLAQYNDYIQSEIVTPGLLSFNGGDAKKAEQMQGQVDAYKVTLVNGYQARYPQNRLFSDHAISVNNCAQKAVPAGEALENLKAALNTMLKLAQLN